MFSSMFPLQSSTPGASSRPPASQPYPSGANPAQQQNYNVPYDKIRPTQPSVNIAATSDPSKGFDDFYKLFQQQAKSSRDTYAKFWNQPGMGGGMAYDQKIANGFDPNLLNQDASGASLQDAHNLFDWTNAARNYQARFGNLQRQ